MSTPTFPVTPGGSVIGAFIYRGAIDCSTNPNYPAAEKGDAYKVSVAGKIGGASGPTVDADDTMYCSADTVGGTHAAVGANWDILQTSTGAVTTDAYGSINLTDPTDANNYIQISPDTDENKTHIQMIRDLISGQTYGMATLGISLSGLHDSSSGSISITADAINKTTNDRSGIEVSASGNANIAGLTLYTDLNDKSVVISANGTESFIELDGSAVLKKADYNAQTILVATADNTPTALTVGEQTLVGRITGGNIDALTVSQVETLLSLGAKATTTTAAMSVYVDQDATGSGTGVDWTNAFTTIQAAIDSLPSLISHAVTIYIRNGTTPYAGATLQRVVGAGSILIKGEYFYAGTPAAGSEAGRFVAAASGIAVGDTVYMICFTGTSSSVPSNAIVDTVAYASGTDIRLTTNTGLTFSEQWRYVAARTKVNYINVTNTNNVTLDGLNIIATATMKIQNCSRFHMTHIIMSSNVWLALWFAETYYNSDTVMSYCAIVHTYASTNGVAVMCDVGRIMAYQWYISSAATTGKIVAAYYGGYANLTYSVLKGASATLTGVIAFHAASILEISMVYLFGTLGIVYNANFGGFVYQGQNVITELTYTTLKDPNGMGADGSYVV